MKIGFISDLFNENIIGGAELNDSVLIDSLEQNFLINKCKSTAVTFDFLNQNDKFIVSNFVTLPFVFRDYLVVQDKKYIIYEHDHKYVKTRDPSRFMNFKIPESFLIHREFYKKAEKVVVLSNICKNILEQNNVSHNVHSIGCSIWSDKTLDFLRNLQDIKKEYKFGVVESQNPIKGSTQAIKYCKQNNIEPILIKSSNYYDFLSKLAKCETLIFFPQVLETFSRLAAEAKMLNCELITIPKMLGFASETYSMLNGNELIDKIHNQKNRALHFFQDWAMEK